MNLYEFDHDLNVLPLARWLVFRYFSLKNGLSSAILRLVIQPSINVASKLQDSDGSYAPISGEIQQYPACFLV